MLFHRESVGRILVIMIFFVSMEFIFVETTLILVIIKSFDNNLNGEELAFFSVMKLNARSIHAQKNKNSRLV